jgi:RNase P/RNase MRP subunit POP5
MMCIIHVLWRNIVQNGFRSTLTLSSGIRVKKYKYINYVVWKSQKSNEGDIAHSIQNNCDSGHGIESVPMAK